MGNTNFHYLDLHTLKNLCKVTIVLVAAFTVADFAFIALFKIQNFDAAISNQFVIILPESGSL